MNVAVVLDQAAGSLRWRQGPDGRRLVGVDLWPDTARLLDRTEGALLLLPDVGVDVVPAAAALLPGVGDVRRLDDGVPDPPADGGPAVFVSADRVLRRAAHERGWRTVPHAAVALGDLDGVTWAFARVRGARGALAALPGVLPYALADHPDGLAVLLGLVPESALDAAAQAGLEVERLALDARLEDPLLVTVDATGAAADLDTAGHRVLWSDGRRALLALDAGTPNDAVPAHGPHGHFEALVPAPGLLLDAPPVGALPAEPGARGDAAAPAPGAVGVTPDDVAPVTAASFLADVERYAGGRDLDARGRVRSRHSSHPDNARAVAALQADLAAMGYTPYTHAFTLGGRTLLNVIADLPGAGDGPPPPQDTVGPGGGTPPAASWWGPAAEVPGLAGELVVVGCHLDSTAARDPGYSPTTSPARGADDNASGVAATLALARHLWGYRGRLRHTVRFCFFNAEESGLVGSKAYAASLKATGAPVRAAVCCDMMGFNSDARRVFEVHAGYTDPRVRDRSVPVAQLVAAHARSLGVLAPAQVYRGTSPFGGTDPAVVDGAINRSDHAAFHEQGYAAVLVSEDFFPNLAGEPAADANPSYHQNSDAVVDGAYGADITRAVSLAVLELAEPIAGGGPERPATRLAAGSTPPGEGWQAYAGGSAGIYLDVATTSGGFTRTPVYVSALHGSDGHWATTGGSAVYGPSPTGFRVYVRLADGAPLTPAHARAWGWSIGWIGAE